MSLARRRIMGWHERGRWSVRRTPDSPRSASIALLLVAVAGSSHAGVVPGVAWDILDLTGGRRVRIAWQHDMTEGGSSKGDPAAAGSATTGQPAPP
jgi:hypothetical protein